MSTRGRVLERVSDEAIYLSSTFEVVSDPNLTAQFLSMLAYPSTGKIGYGAFVEDGGPEVMRMVATVWKEDKEIVDATNALARPPSGHVESAWRHKGGCGCAIS